MYHFSKWTKIFPKYIIVLYSLHLSWVHCNVSTVQYSLLYVLWKLQSTLNVQWMCSMYFSNVQCTICNVQCTLCTVQCTEYTMLCIFPPAWVLQLRWCTAPGWRWDWTPGSWPSPPDTLQTYLQHNNVRKYGGYQMKRLFGLHWKVRLGSMVRWRRWESTRKALVRIIHISSDALCSVDIAPKNYFRSIIILKHLNRVSSGYEVNWRSVGERGRVGLTGLPRDSPYCIVYIIHQHRIHFMRPKLT